MESRHGILTNILVGIAGAFVGGELANLLNIDVFGFFRTLISATIGAIVILFIWRQIRATLPSAPISTVVRMIPRNVLPYRDFSPHAPYASSI